MAKEKMADLIRSIRWGEDYNKGEIKISIVKDGWFYHVKVTRGITCYQDCAFTLWGAKRMARKFARYYEDNEEVIYKGSVEGLEFVNSGTRGSD